MQAGEFILEKNIFFTEEGKYCIRERKSNLDKKPKLFMVKLSPFQYVSSLFPGEEENTYHFDFKQELYSLKLKKDKVEVTKVEPITEIE